MQYQSELIWLAKQIEKQKITTEPSLWNAIRQAEFSGKRSVGGRKRHVYITGEPQLVYDVTYLAESIAELQEVTTFTTDNSKHPALQWMDITYYPPTHLAELHEAQTLTLFVDNRLPIWSRPLFKANQIGNVVAVEEIAAVQSFEQVSFYTLAAFSYMNLLDDVIVKEKKVFERPAQQLFPEIPKHVLAQLSMIEDKQALQVAIDEAAASMLNAYWLQNNPPFPEWMPVLLKEIQALLSIKTSSNTAQMAIDKLKVWGNRDKRINGI